MDLLSPLSFCLSSFSEGGGSASVVVFAIACSCWPLLVILTLSGAEGEESAYLAFAATVCRLSLNADTAHHKTKSTNFHI
jgi:hypothetical protein